MRQLTPEQIGIDYRALLDLIGEERVNDVCGAALVSRHLYRAMQSGHDAGHRLRWN